MKRDWYIKLDKITNLGLLNVNPGLLENIVLRAGKSII